MMSTPRPPYEDNSETVIATPGYGGPNLRKPAMPVVAPTAELPSWREPVDEVDEDGDEPPFADEDEQREAAAPVAPRERYWTESRILRLGSLALFVVFSSIAAVKIGLAFPSVAWIPYVVLAIAYGAIMLKELDAHHTAEEGARTRAERAERSRLRMGGS